MERYMRSQQTTVALHGTMSHCSRPKLQLTPYVGCGTFTSWPSDKLVKLSSVSVPIMVVNSVTRSGVSISINMVFNMKRLHRTLPNKTLVKGDIAPLQTVHVR